MTIRLMHISDVHVGDAEPFVLAAALDAAAVLKPDLIVATGDLTEAGRRREFRQLAGFLEALPAPVLGCAGNHDVPVFNPLLRLAAPFARFRRLGLRESWDSPCGTVQMRGFTSARGIQPRLDWSQGAYGRRFEAALTGLVAGPAGSGEPVWRILACHHPPLTPPGARVTSTPREITGALATLSARSDVMMLCGHVHGHWDLRLGQSGARVVTAPSLASRRQRGGVPGFLAIELGPDGCARIRPWRFEDGVFAPPDPQQPTLHTSDISMVLNEPRARAAALSLH